jgi:hypothetical protein
MDPKPIKAFAKGQEEVLAAKLVSLDGMVLVCWEHEAIVEKLLPAIAKGQRPPRRDDVARRRVEQPKDDLREAANGRISHRRPAGFIRDIRICMARQQLLGDAIVALQGCDREWRQKLRGSGHDTNHTI